MARGKAISWRRDHEVWLSENAKGVSRVDLWSAFLQEFGCTVPAGATINNMIGLMKRLKITNGRKTTFEKGHAPANKGTKGLMKSNSGTFKKGRTPANLRPLGSERICSKDGYALVKVSNDSPRWKLKHIVLWEAENGPVPEGWRLKLLDNDRANPTLDNIMLIPAGASVMVNRFNPANTDSPELNKIICLTEALRYMSNNPEFVL